VFENIAVYKNAVRCYVVNTSRDVTARHVT